MRITVITPLFPPDVGGAAVYAKELATHLALQAGNTVTCLHYGQLPETVPGVTYISIPKDVTRIKRLVRFGRALYAQRHSDALIILNGPSVDVPTVLLSPLLPKRGIYLESDQDAVTASRGFYKLIPYLLKKRFQTLRPSDTIIYRPIIHPLHDYPTAARSTYDQAWTQHVTDIKNLCQPN